MAILLAAGAIAGAYFWWKTRDLRKQMREFPPGGVEIEAESFEEEASRGRVIEGEAVRVDDLRDSDKS